MVQMDSPKAGAAEPCRLQPAPDRLHLAQTLSQREISVLGLIGAGLANKEIAWQLGIAEGTVKAHAAAINRKMGFRSRVVAAIWWVVHGVHLAAR